jgi:hypothetical protein
MTPQERQLLNELFDRLASLENAPRDPDAVAAINDGLRRAPNALYPLVQSVLVQDEALKRADGRIRELENELGIEPGQPAKQGGFLDNMRDALSSRREQQGSVPTVKPGAPAAAPSPWNNTSTSAPNPAPSPAPNSAPSPWRTTSVPPGGNPAPAGGYDAPQAQAAPGGSFLGTAAAAAAGAIGGSLLMNSFRGMFGGQHGSGHGAFGSGSAGTPWAPSASGSDLARDAGVNDIGGGGRTAAADDGSQRAGLFDTAANDAGDSDVDNTDLDDDTDGDFDAGDDSDTA